MRAIGKQAEEIGFLKNLFTLTIHATKCTTEKFVKP